MKLYSENKQYKLYCGNMLDMLEDIEPNSIGSIVTDPPYELGFMGKSWDNSGIAFQVDTWRKCYEVLKPGGYLLAFGGSRTFHRIACAIEDAGFEIRDTVMWLYGCLSEDTEILTRRGFKKFNEISESDEIRIYDIEANVYKWERPQRWNIYTADKDTCYRIKSDSTDQLVSRNHRCLVEREGKLVFEFAENLSDVERVPVLSYDIPYIQKVRGRASYQTTLATITKEEYSGVIFCPTVSTGCFVARRNGFVFITGNSGFPKSMNIGLAFDKKEGVQGQRGVGGFNVGGIQEQQNRKAKLYIGSTTDGSKQDAYTDYKTDLAKQWQGWGTALKPSYEPIIVARKPCEGSCVDNVLKWGVGGINIDECRVSTNDILTHGDVLGKQVGDGRTGKALGMFQDGTENTFVQNPNGRFPANTILTYDDTDFEEVCGGFPYSKSNGGASTMPDLRDVGKKSKESIGIDKLSFGQVRNAKRKASDYMSPCDEGSAARYFYCAKQARKTEMRV